MQPSIPALERRIAVAVMLAAFAGAFVAFVAITWPPAGRVRAKPGGAEADAIANAISRGSAPASLIETLTAAGTVRAAAVYNRAGTVVASAGVPSRTAELICRSLPSGGSLCIEPAPNPLAQEALGVGIRVAIGATIAGALIALAATSFMRGRFRAVRAGVDEAIRDPAYATRITTGAGAMGPLTTAINQLLDQVQMRDVVLRRRTTELEAANRELESFASAVSHDLRAPLGSISGFAQALEEDAGPSLDAGGRECLFWIRESARQMSELMEGLLQMARLSRVEMSRTDVDLSAIARAIAASLQRGEPSRGVMFAIPDGVTANGDERLLRAVLENLVGNAWKFTSERQNARIELGVRYDDGQPAFYIRDNGAGFDPRHAAKMFRPFQRLHSEKEFAGTGIGLATVHKIVERHGGRTWAEGEPDRGATVYFTTGAPPETYA